MSGSDQSPETPLAELAGVTRLQLGVGRLEDLDERVLPKFLDRSWLHLGDATGGQERRGMGDYLTWFRRRPVQFSALVLRRLLGRDSRLKRSTLPPETLYEQTRFEGFHFAKGQRLRFADHTFEYIFSEHFLHHLFFDEAFALLEECYRILKPGGVIRTVVPDADLRTYLRPEPAGFPDAKMSFLEPLKHKTRYSVYMLTESLRLAGFEAIPLRYCDRHGNYVRHDPARELRERYRLAIERSFVFELGHVMRLDSLIVDGLKPGGGPVGESTEDRTRGLSAGGVD
jgi:predicted SAM-dependent methyltransferase